MEDLKISEEGKKKVMEHLKAARKAFLGVFLISMLLGLVSVVPVVLLSMLFGVLHSVYPTVLGIISVLIIQFKYVKPRTDMIVKRLHEQLKQILEEERTKP
jgi:uncharacterized membrane protein YhaH (DUF805 family)